MLVAFFVIWIPLTWLFEPTTNLDAGEGAARPTAIDRGRRAVQLFSEENQVGVGCVRCHGPELRGRRDPEHDDPGYAYPPEPHHGLRGDLRTGARR